MKTVEPFKFSDKGAASITMGEGTELESQAKVNSQTEEVLAIDRSKGIRNSLEDQRKYFIAMENLQRSLQESKAIQDAKPRNEMILNSIEAYIEQLKDDPMYDILQETFGTDYGEKLKQRILRKKGVKGAIP